MPDATQSLVVTRLWNPNLTAEGSNLPPLQVGEFRVPFPAGFQVLQTSNTSAGTQFTLGWLAPEGLRGQQVNNYSIYVKNAYGNADPTFLGSSANSPCTFTVPGSITGNVVFFLQPTLANGLTVPVAQCPTCTGSTTQASITPASLNTQNLFISGLTLTNNSPSAGKIAWSGCTVYYNGSTYSVSSGSTSSTTNKFVTWTIGSTNFVPQDSYTPSATVFLIATNTSGTSDTAWDKVALGHIQESNLAFNLIPSVALNVIVATENANVGNGTTNVTILSVSNAHGGGILELTFQRNAGVGGTVLQTNILITCDGQVFTLNLIDGTLAWTTVAKLMALRISGTGNGAGDTLLFQFGTGFNSTLGVTLQYVTNATSAVNDTVLVSYAIAP